MLSRSPLLKANSFVVQNEDAVVIDSNERMAAKIEEIASSLKNVEQNDLNTFSEGIEAGQVAALLTGEEEGNVIHQPEQPVYDGPTPEELIAEAQAEIENMRRAAQANLNSERDATLRRAMEDGHRQGYQEGFEEGRRQAALENQAKERELEEKERMLQEEFQRRLAELEPMMLDTLTNIYEHVFEIDMSGNRNVIMHLVENTLHRIDGGANYLVRVSKEDFPYISMQKQAVLEKCITSSANLEVVEDITLAADECLIETDSGIYDCSVGTELKELKKQLMLLSYEE